jgi:hypothetical protein
MAKSRPSLNVQAQPVSTFVAPMAASTSVELYDQQTVNLALQFADAFKDFSLTAAKLAGTLKQENNEEEVLKGIDMVNKSQKSYKQLMDSGEIKPTENPWMAIGAQKASGTAEGLKARAHFMEMYNRRVEEDPSFLSGPEGFSALAAQYTANVNSMIGNAPYMSRAFYESFNPFIGSMALNHEENVQKEQERKVGLGINAAVAQAIQDSRSADPLISGNATSGLQEYIDGLSNSGYSGKKINQVTAAALVEAMANSDDPTQAQSIFNSLKSGTGFLKDTEYAKVLLLAKTPEIEARKQRLTDEESDAFNKFRLATIKSVVSNEMTEEEGAQKIQEFLKTKITITGQEYESKIGYYNTSLKSAKAEAQAQYNQRVEDNIFTAIENLSTMVSPEESGLSENDLLLLKRDQLKAQMSSYPENIITPKDRLAYLNALDQQFARDYDRRSVAKAEAATTALWGTGDAPGLLQNASASFGPFMAGGDMVELPPLNQYRQVLEQAYTQQGVVPNSEQMNKLMAQGYTRFDAVISQQEQIIGQQFRSKSLAPSAQDTPEERNHKSAFRARATALRMQMGVAMGVDAQADKTLRSFIAGFNTATVETGFPDDFIDTIQAFAINRRLNLPTSSFIPNPDSQNGKQMIQIMDYASDKYANGMDPTDIARDIVQMKVIPGSLKTNPFDFSRPLGWVEFDSGSGKDAQDLYDGGVVFREQNNIVESDSTLYAATAYAKATFKHLGSDAIGNMRKAQKLAAEELAGSHIFFNGSMIPNKNLNRSVDGPYIQAWLDSNKFPEGTTLVVVQQNSDGTAMLAPRKDGKAVSGTRDGKRLENMMVRSTDLNTVGPEVIKDFNSKLEASRGKPSPFTTAPTFFTPNQTSGNARVPGVYYPY